MRDIWWVLDGQRMCVRLAALMNVLSAPLSFIFAGGRGWDGSLRVAALANARATTFRACHTAAQRQWRCQHNIAKHVP